MSKYKKEEIDNSEVKLLQKYYNQLKSKCKICNGKGIIMVTDDTFKDCICTEKYLKNIKYIKAGILSSYIDLFDDIKKNLLNKSNKNIKIIYKNIDLIKAETNLYISKKHRTSIGSSSLLMLIAKYFVDNGHNVVVASLSEIVDSFYLGCNKYETCDILCINNFGYEYNRRYTNNTYIAQNILSLLQARNTDKKFTVISSSKTINKVRVEYPATLIEYIEQYFMIYEIDIKSKYKLANEKMKHLLPELKLYEKEVKQKSKTKKPVKNVDRSEFDKIEEDVKIENPFEGLDIE